MTLFYHVLNSCEKRRDPVVCVIYGLLWCIYSTSWCLLILNLIRCLAGTFIGLQDVLARQRNRGWIPGRYRSHWRLLRHGVWLRESPGLLANGVGVKRTSHEVDHSPSSNAKVKNEVIFPFTLPYAFIAWCLIKLWDNFTVLTFSWIRVRLPM
jgi:hypothetical protein